MTIPQVGPLSLCVFCTAAPVHLKFKHTYVYLIFSSGFKSHVWHTYNYFYWKSSPNTKSSYLLVLRDVSPDHKISLPTLQPQSSWLISGTSLNLIFRAPSKHFCHLLQEQGILCCVLSPNQNRVKFLRLLETIKYFSEANSSLFFPFSLEGNQCIVVPTLSQALHKLQIKFA